VGEEDGGWGPVTGEGADGMAAEDKFAAVLQ